MPVSTHSRARALQSHGLNTVEHPTSCCYNSIIAPPHTHVENRKQNKAKQSKKAVGETSSGTAEQSYGSFGL